MYGNPPVHGDYFFISDKNNEPIFFSQNFLMSGAKLKKLFFSTCKEYLNTNEPNMFRNNMTAFQYCGAQALGFFSELAKDKVALDKAKPLTLNWVFIELQEQDFSFKKKTTVIATLGDQKPPPKPSSSSSSSSSSKKQSSATKTITTEQLDDKTSLK